MHGSGILTRWLLEILAPEGSTLAVGKSIARLRSGDGVEPETPEVVAPEPPVEVAGEPTPQVEAEAGEPSPAPDDVDLPQGSGGAG